jgi:hypothetical protein
MDFYIHLIIDYHLFMSMFLVPYLQIHPFILFTIFYSQNLCSIFVHFVIYFVNKYFIYYQINYFIYYANKYFIYYWINYSIYYNVIYFIYFIY